MQVAYKKSSYGTLVSNKSTRSTQLNSLSELGHRFPFDGVTQSPEFCPKQHRQTVWQVMEKHLHQHPLIPTSDSQFQTSTAIYEAAIIINEMYAFCRENSLIYLWSLKQEMVFVGVVCMWRKDLCIKNDNVCRGTLESYIGQGTTILSTPSSIQVRKWSCAIQLIKRDILYKFFQLCLDLVYMLMTKVIPHQQRKLQQILSGRENPEWIKQLKSEWRRLAAQPINNAYITDVDGWICGCPYYLINRGTNVFVKVNFTVYCTWKSTHFTVQSWDIRWLGRRS